MVRTLALGALVALTAFDASAQSTSPDEPAAATAAPAEEEAEPAVPGGAAGSVLQPSTRGPGSGVEEILVTGRKREELLQDVPVSMVALSANDLETKSITQIDEIGQSVAGLKFDTAVGSNSAARVYIRGVGQDDQRTNVDAGVGLYLDGVYLPRAAGSILALTDIERVEVLRGPQGTLYGKNTIGGVINVITRRPTSEYEGDASVRVGNYDLLHSNATLNVPFPGAWSETAMARFNFATRTSDGYVKSTIEDEFGGDDKLLFGRAQLRFLPTEDLDVNLAFERSREYEKEPIGECRLETKLALNTFIIDNTQLFREACQESSEATSEFKTNSQAIPKNEQDVTGFTGTATWDLGDYSVKSLSSWRRVTNRNRTGDFDAVRAGFLFQDRGRRDGDVMSQEFLVNGVAFDDAVNWSAGVYGFRELGDEKTYLQIQPDLVLNPNQPLVGTPLLTLAGQPVGDQLGAIIDGTNGALGIPVGAVSGGLDTFAELNLLTAGLIGGLVADDGGEPLSLLEITTSLNRRNVTRFENLSYASFAEATWDATDHLSLTGGARYTAERRSRQGKSLPVFPFAKQAGQPSLGDEQNERYGKWTGRAILQYRFTDELNAFTSFSRGFRSGGFNQAGVGQFLSGGMTNDPIGDKFDTEVLDSYEFGVKSSWLDSQLVLNLSAFYNEYEDIQLSIVTVGDNGLATVFIENAGEAVVQGLELDFQARPSFLEGLSLSGGVSLINADYKEFNTDQVAPFDQSICPSLRLSECPLELLDLFAPGTTGMPPSPFARALAQFINPTIQRDTDRSDLDFKQTPAFSFNAQADYLFRIGEWGALATSIQWYHQGRTFQTTFNAKSSEQPKFGLLNGRIAWEMADGNTTVAFFARNILDRRYIAAALDLVNITGTTQAFYAPPRTYGLEVRRRF